MRNTHSENVSADVTTNDPQERECAYPGCKKKFIANRRWQLFCCRECRGIYWKELRKEVMKEIEKRRSI